MYVNRYNFIEPTKEEIEEFDKGTSPITRGNGWRHAFPYRVNSNGDREWLIEAEWGEIVIVDTAWYPNLQCTDALPLIYLVADSLNIPQLETDQELEIFHVLVNTSKVVKIFEAICEHCMRVKS